MKVEFENGKVTATAESIADVKLLLGLNSSTIVPQDGPQRPSVWKGKHAKECPECGKKFKNIGVHSKAHRSTLPPSVHVQRNVSLLEE